MVFNKVSDLQFSFLLFLIFERIDGKSNWLVKSFDDLRKLGEFKRIREICDFPDKLNPKKGWWDDSLNVRKKGYVLAINKKLNDKGVSGKLIEKQKNIKGSYCLNTCVIASVG